MSIAKEIQLKEKINSIRHEALLNIVLTANYLDRKAYEYFKRFNITKAQYNVLIVLKLEGNSLTQVQIGERLVVSRAGVTAVLDKLERMGYIERQHDESDRRVFRIRLTEKGKKIVDTIEPDYVAEVEKTMQSLSANQCRELSRTLEVLRRAVKTGM